MTTNSSVTSALGLVKKGEVLSLDSGWWHGMPVHPVHPQFSILTYRSPRGLRIHQDAEYINPPNNSVNYAFISELIMGTSHTGTHIDAGCHIVGGPDSEWHGGHRADDELGDFGAMSEDASQLPPIVARGVLLDIPKVLGTDCPVGYAITAEELSNAADLAGVDVLPGDVVLVRTGQMKSWPDTDAMASVEGAGVSLEGARWIAGRNPIAVGADTASFECYPSGVEGSPEPVHLFLIQERGIPIMEWVNCEPLVSAGVSEFLFVCLPLTLRGATGSMVRPIAVI